MPTTLSASLAPPITQGYNDQSEAPIPSSTATRSQPTTIEDDDTDTATIAEGTGTEVEEGDPTDVVKARDGLKAESELSQLSREEKPLSLGQNVWKWTKIVLRFLLDQWFALGVGFVIGMAAAFPNVARTGGVLKAEFTIKFLLVAIIFFVSGLTLPLRNLYHSAGDYKLHVVTQGTCFLIFPTLVFAIINCVRASDPNFRKFDRNALIGMQVMSVVPTTVSSNVVMTGQAGGDEAASTTEVIIGNLLGTFLSPALLEMFFASSRWEFGRPDAGQGGGIGEVYRKVIEQLGYTVFIPLFVGEVIQYIWPKQTKLVRTKLRLGKVGSLCLLGVVWSTFSTSFYEGAFDILSGEAITFILMTNIFLYILLSIFLFVLARYVPYPRRITLEDGQKVRVKGPLFDPETTISLCFCGAAKGAALGAPIVAILYSGVPSQAGGIISLPIVLYQGSQIVLGQITVAILKAWHKRVKASEAKFEEEKGERGERAASEGKAGETERGERTEKRREGADTK